MRYSQLYVDRIVRIADSARARRRLWAELRPLAGSILISIYQNIERELGYKFPAGETYTGGVKYFIEQSRIQDLLDGITVIFEALQDGRRWVSFVTRVFSEESLGYRIDGRGVVHPFVDTEFEINLSAALDALNQDRFGESRHDFDEAFRHLSAGEGKAAIRMMFPAVETAAKVLFPGRLSRLMPNDIDRHVLPRLRERYANNLPALTAGKHLLESMKTWIVASQPYRHGQEQEAVTEPPKDFVIAYLSAGATYLRWMIELCE
jgi:hypothetical protein